MSVRNGKRSYFNLDQSLYDIISEYPATIPLFISEGFTQLADEKMRRQFGKGISLRNALFYKKLNSESFSRMLVEAIESDETGEGIFDPFPSD